MPRKQISERGQALILIVFGLVAMIGITGLAIDGGQSLSNRRQAQNAADAAALSAAQARIREKNFIQAALEVAQINGFNNDGETNTVEIFSPPYNGAYVGNEEYIQVRIQSQVKTTFANVVGVQQLTNVVDAVARGKPGEYKPMFEGNAMVSLMPGCSPQGWPSDPFTISGNSTSIVGGAGVFVNSDCAGAFNQNGGASMDVTGGYQICVMGGYNYAPGSISPPPDHCGDAIPYPPDTLFAMPQPYCATNGTMTEISSSPTTYLATAGNYSDFPNVNPNGKVILQKGVYCLNNGFKLNSQWDLTTDVNGNGVQDDDEGVLFFVPSGDVTFNGSSTMDLNAMKDGPFADLLIYLPLTNDSTVKLNGASGTQFSGSILAPASLITTEGNNTSYNVNSQLIGFSLSTSGSANITINYDNGNNYNAYYLPEIELVK